MRVPLKAVNLSVTREDRVLNDTITLLDGGMGQELYRRSGQPASPLWSAAILQDDPDMVRDLHMEYIAAGAEVIGVSAYTVTPERMERDADITLFKPLQEAAVRIANEARDKSGEKVRISGSLPPLVASYHADVVPDDAQCLASYRRIVAAQNHGVDVFICETMSCVREAVAATTAACESGKPVWTSMTIDDRNGEELRSGERLADAVTAVHQAGADVLLVNCSSPEAVTQAVPVLMTTGLPCGGYANGFVAANNLQPGGTVDGLAARTDLGPTDYADHADQWMKAGARIVGGCCEVGPAHIAELASRLGKTRH